MLLVYHNCFLSACLQALVSVVKSSWPLKPFSMAVSWTINELPCRKLRWHGTLFMWWEKTLVSWGWNHVYTVSKIVCLACSLGNTKDKIMCVSYFIHELNALLLMWHSWKQNMKLCIESGLSNFVLFCELCCPGCYKVTFFSHQMSLY